MAGWRSLLTLLILAVFAFVAGSAEEVFFKYISAEAWHCQSTDLSSIFQASEVEEEETEVPEESFTSTKEFKVTHCSHSDIG